jgi:hypothetical protein
MFHVQETLLRQKNMFYRGTSRPLQCQQQTLLGSRSMCVLSSEPTQACIHAILVSSAKQHAQFSEAGLTLQLFGEQTCEGSSQIFRACVRHCAGRRCGVEYHFLTRLSDARTNASQICKSMLLDLGSPDLT